MKQGNTVTFKTPEKAGSPYQKVDFAKAGRLGNDYVVTFFQVDYQQVIEAFEKSKASGVSLSSEQSFEPIPVARLVLDKDGFDRVLNELQLLKNNVLADDERAGLGGGRAQN
jgi:hypothetical protein